MYLKITGSICIIVACAGYGFSKGREYKKHVDELEELRRIAMMFATETSYSKLPIAELSSRISKKVKEPFKGWLIGLSLELKKENQEPLMRVWKKEAEHLLEILSLTEEESDELKNLGVQIGNYNIQMQENAFRWYADILNEKRGTLMKEVSERQRLCNSLGVLAGIFLVILLI